MDDEQEQRPFTQWSKKRERERLARIERQRKEAALMSNKCKRCGIAGGCHAQCANDLWVRVRELEAANKKLLHFDCRYCYGKIPQPKQAIDEIRALRAELEAKTKQAEAWRGAAEEWEMYEDNLYPRWDESATGREIKAKMAKARALDNATEMGGES